MKGHCFHDVVMTLTHLWHILTRAQVGQDWQSLLMHLLKRVSESTAKTPEDQQMGPDTNPGLLPLFTQCAP